MKLNSLFGITASKLLLEGNLHAKKTGALYMRP